MSFSPDHLSSMTSLSDLESMKARPTTAKNVSLKMRLSLPVQEDANEKAKADVVH